MANNQGRIDLKPGTHVEYCTKYEADGGVLTGVIVLLVQVDSIPASACQEGGRFKSPPPSSTSPSNGLGDKEPSYNRHTETVIMTSLHIEARTRQIFKHLKFIMSFLL